jgi:hypothetical protein
MIKFLKSLFGVEEVVEEEDFDTVRQYSIDGRKWRNCQAIGYRYYPKFKDWEAAITKDGTKIRLVRKTL